MDLDDIIIIAAEKGDLATLELHLRKTIFNIGTLDLAQYMATICKKYDAAKFLIQNGATVISGLNESLYVACSDGNLSFVSFLLAHGANDLDRALLAAARYNQIEVLVYLLEKGGTSYITTISSTEDTNIRELLYAAITRPKL